MGHMHDVPFSFFHSPFLHQNNINASLQSKTKKVCYRFLFFFSSLGAGSVLAPASFTVQIQIPPESIVHYFECDMRLNVYTYLYADIILVAVY